MLTNFERKFVDFCCNDIEAKSSFLLFATAEKSAAKRLFAFSTFYNHYNVYPYNFSEVANLLGSDAWADAEEAPEGEDHNWEE